MMPAANGKPDIDMSVYGTQIGIVMLIAFAFNLLFARFTKWKSVFLTGHMLYWFPYVFIAAGVDAGLTGGKLIGLATIFTAAYMVISPNLMRPLVREVTGDDSFTIGHPTTCLLYTSILVGLGFGVVAIYVIVSNLTKPIRRLVECIRDSRENKLSGYQMSDITEVDELYEVVRELTNKQQEAEYSLMEEKERYRIALQSSTAVSYTHLRQEI